MPARRPDQEIGFPVPGCLSASLAAGPASCPLRVKRSALRQGPYCFIYSLLWGLTQRSHIATGRRPQGAHQVAKRSERFNGNQRRAEREVRGFRPEHPDGQRANRSVRKFAEDVFTMAIL